MRRLANILTLLFHMTVSIGVGRCSDLGGGDIFLNNKNVISLRNNAYMQ